MALFSGDQWWLKDETKDLLSEAARRRLALMKGTSSQEPTRVSRPGESDPTVESAPATRTTSERGIPWGPVDLTKEQIDSVLGPSPTPEPAAPAPAPTGGTQSLTDQFNSAPKTSGTGYDTTQFVQTDPVGATSMPESTSSSPAPDSISRRLKAFSPTKQINTAGWQTPQTVPIEQQAQDLVQLQYGSQERGLEEAQRQAIANYNRLAHEERAYGDKVDPRLENIYSALQTSLGENKNINQQTYQDAISQIREWYDQAHGDSAQLNQDIMNRITTDAERLGIEAGIPAGTERMTEDYLYNQMQNRESQAGRSANLLELAAQIGVLDQNRIGSAQREGAQQRATLQNEIAQTLGDLGLAHYNELSGLRSELAGLMGDRGAAQRQALSELQQRDFENLQTSRGNALDEFLSRSGLALNQSEFERGNYEADRNYELARDELGLSRELGLGGLDIDRQRISAEQQAQQQGNAIRWAELELDRQALSAEQAQWQAEFAEATSPEARARAKAELDRIRAETEALNREQLASQYEPGEIGLDNYIRANGINPTLRSAGRAIINEAINSDDPPTAAFNKINESVKAGFMSDQDAQTLRNMITVYFAGTGGGG